MFAKRPHRSGNTCPSVPYQTLICRSILVVSADNWGDFWPRAVLTILWTGATRKLIRSAREEPGGAFKMGTLKIWFSNLGRHALCRVIRWPKVGSLTSQKVATHENGRARHFCGPGGWGENRASLCTCVRGRARACVKKPLIIDSRYIPIRRRLLMNQRRRNKPWLNYFLRRELFPFSGLLDVKELISEIWDVDVHNFVLVSKTVLFALNKEKFDHGLKNCSNLEEFWI